MVAPHKYSLNGAQILLEKNRKSHIASRLMELMVDHEGDLLERALWVHFQPMLSFCRAQALLFLDFRDGISWHSICTCTHTHFYWTREGRVLVLVIDLFPIRQNVRLDRCWNRSWCTDLILAVSIALQLVSGICCVPAESSICQDGGMQGNGIFSGFYSLLEIRITWMQAKILVVSVSHRQRLWRKQEWESQGCG